MNSCRGVRTPGAAATNRWMFGYRIWMGVNVMVASDRMRMSEKRCGLRPGQVTWNKFRPVRSTKSGSATCSQGGPGASGDGIEDNVCCHNPARTGLWEPE